MPPTRKRSRCQGNMIPRAMHRQPVCRQVTGLQQNVRMVQEAATCLGFIGSINTANKNPGCGHQRLSCLQNYKGILLNIDHPLTESDSYAIVGDSQNFAARVLEAHWVLRPLPLLQPCRTFSRGFAVLPGISKEENNCQAMTMLSLSDSNPRS